VLKLTPDTIVHERLGFELDERSLFSLRILVLTSIIVQIMQIMASNTTKIDIRMATESSHPYYPLGVSIPNYVENTISTPAILIYFVAACATLMLTSYGVIKTTKPRLGTGDVATALWFILCGCIHIGIEG
jgi:hypothetical protein